VEIQTFHTCQAGNATFGIRRRAALKSGHF
jgi:hypothetical protein